MKATVIVAFTGRPDGDALPRTIEVGEIITGDLARAAVEQNWAEPIGAAKPEAEPVDLDSMTVDELKAFATENDIDLGDASKKADIRAAIDACLAG